MITPKKEVPPFSRTSFFGVLYAAFRKPFAELGRLPKPASPPLSCKARKNSCTSIYIML